jgi:hypothetical protein
MIDACIFALDPKKLPYSERFLVSIQWAINTLVEVFSKSLTTAKLSLEDSGGGRSGRGGALALVM